MNGVILRWPVPIGTTINAQYYKKVLQDKLRPANRKKRLGLLESGILFHHDNAPVHTARAVTDVLAGYKWELLEHPRYSPDFAPCDFHLFPKMKEHLRGQRFETEEDIIQATKHVRKGDKISPAIPSLQIGQTQEKIGQRQCLMDGSRLNSTHLPREGELTKDAIAQVLPLVQSSGLVLMTRDCEVAIDNSPGVSTRGVVCPLRA
ncbi:hypothetical protein RRG08_037462 [Elysia crispata]|uniref:Tc1-like transposase DDE domain-containing protein n=1 Tax=Elysia crispata TaxID=231223 RepID=A0AAE1E735_9GAST|nr:hypothetical protein RRG08_037462 [Elysia crispata]